MIRRRLLMLGGVTAASSFVFVHGVVGNASIWRGSRIAVGLQNGAKAAATVTLETRRAAEAVSLGKMLTRVRTLGYGQRGDGGEAVYVETHTLPTHAGWFRSTDGRIWEIADPVLKPQMFGAVTQADDYAVFSEWALATRTLGRDWEIPPGDYILNGGDVLSLTTSGVCRGRLIIPAANTACRIVIARDAPGEVIDTSGWSSMVRGSTDIAATNAAGRTMVLTSAEILIERAGTDPPYLKQETVRIQHNSGKLSTPLVCSYLDRSKLIATAHAPSVPILITGLAIGRNGPGPVSMNDLPSLEIERDHVTINDLSIGTLGSTPPLSIVVNTRFCTDVTFNRPIIRGAADETHGLGYGLLFSTTIGCCVNNPDIHECRESIAGRHNVDLMISGGTTTQIDDHWGDRFIVRGTVIRPKMGNTAVTYAGNDILLDGIRADGGRGVLGIRADTPHLGGEVILKNISAYSRDETGGAYYLVAFTAPDGPKVDSEYARLPSLPDLISMEGGTLDVDIATAYLAYLGLVPAPHVNWGRIRIVGDWSIKATGNVVGVFLVKDASHQRSRATDIAISGGGLNFGIANAVFVVARDASQTRAANVTITDLEGGNLRFSPFGVVSLVATRGRIGTVENDDPREAGGKSLYLIRQATMTGGYVSRSFTNIGFFGCVFAGTYTDFPGISDVTMIDNRLAPTASGLPRDITTNLTPAFQRIANQSGALRTAS